MRTPMPILEQIESLRAYLRTLQADFNWDPRRYIVTDVEWSKADAYHYVVTQLTHAGHLYKRGGDTWVSPSNRIKITRCDEPLTEETLRQCAYYRSNAE